MFWVLEGLEGSGKSTAITYMADRIKSLGYDVVLTREPGGTELSEQLRNIILNNNNICSLTELLLINAARAEHINKVIKPALEQGKFVLSDRFYLSTLAYQGYGKNIPISTIAALNALIYPEITPDFTILLDIDPHTCMSRIAHRAFKDKFELQDEEFYSLVRRGYLDCAREQKHTLSIIDATKDTFFVKRRIDCLIENLIEKRN